MSPVEQLKEINNNNNNCYTVNKSIHNNNNHSTVNKSEPEWAHTDGRLLVCLGTGSVCLWYVTSSEVHQWHKFDSYQQHRVLVYRARPSCAAATSSVWADRINCDQKWQRRQRQTPNQTGAPSLEQERDQSKYIHRTHMLVAVNCMLVMVVRCLDWLRSQVMSLNSKLCNKYFYCNYMKVMTINNNIINHTN